MTWEQEWRRMQLWLMAGYLTLVISTAIAFGLWFIGAAQVAIPVAILGALIDLAMIARGMWSYVKVMRLRAADRAVTAQNRPNREWLVAVAFLVIPLALYTLWYVKVR